MVYKTSKRSVPRIHIRQGDHRGGRDAGTVKEQGVFVDEVAECRFGMRMAYISLGRKTRFRKREPLTEVLHFLLFGFEILVTQIRQNEIEEHKAGLNKFNGMPAPVTEVLFPDFLVECLGK